MTTAASDIHLLRYVKGDSPLHRMWAGTKILCVAIIGIAVFAGMTMASTVGLFFIPMLYVVIQGAAYMVSGNRKAIQGTMAAQPALQGGHH